MPAAVCFENRVAYLAADTTGADDDDGNPERCKELIVEEGSAGRGDAARDGEGDKKEEVLCSVCGKNGVACVQGLYGLAG